MAVEGTLAGRAFSTLDLQWNGDNTLLWVPMVEGNERLGVIGYELAGPPGDPDAFVAAVVELTGQAAELVVTKSDYGDFFEFHRRREPMSIASELAWQLLPPLTFGSDRVVISGALAPAYDLGGDSFDYGVDADTARIAVFDAMGHGLEAGLLATVAVAAYRNSRRTRLKLAETAAAIDEAIRVRFGAERFVTAVLASSTWPPARSPGSGPGTPPPCCCGAARSSRPCGATPACPSGWAPPATRPTSASSPATRSSSSPTG